MWYLESESFVPFLREIKSRRSEMIGIFSLNLGCLRADKYVLVLALLRLVS